MERDLALLLDMRLAAEDAVAFVAGLDEASFLASRLHQSAVLRALTVLGEAANKVSSGCRERHEAISWRSIIGLRHRLVHGYGDVRLDIVWGVVAQDLKPLIATLRAVTEGVQDPDSGTRRGLLATLAGLDPIEEDLPPIADDPPEPYDGS